MVWDFLLPYGNRKIKCNSPVDCCLPPARWRQHLCRRPFPDGDANDSRTGHRKNLPGACFLGRGRFHRSESAAGTAVKSERFICFASRRSRLDGADTFGPTRFVIALIIATFLDFAFCILHFVRQHDKSKFICVNGIVKKILFSFVEMRGNGRYNGIKAQMVLSRLLGTAPLFQGSFGYFSTK